jgi:dTDP-4-dehydrorhamnose reductase
MRILLIGKNGQVGWELERTLAPLGEGVAVDFPEIDLANSAGVRNLVRKVQPQVIVNAAAYTDVDKAESEPDLAFAINGTAPRILAEEAKAIGAALIHYSTDYVFDGQKGEPYVETDLPNPINTYGQSKLAGERAIQAVDGTYLIFRTSWVYSTRQKCFITQVLRWAREQKILRIVTDQVGSPTWCRMLAEMTAQVLGMSRDNVAGWLLGKKGIYHLAGDGSVSRFEWAQAILKNDPAGEEKVVQDLLPGRSFEFPSPAQRPPSTPLSCDLFTSVFKLRLPPWEAQLSLALAALKKN